MLEAASPEIRDQASRADHHRHRFVAGPVLAGRNSPAQSIQAQGHILPVEAVPAGGGIVDGEEHGGSAGAQLMADISGTGNTLQLGHHRQGGGLQVGQGGLAGSFGADDGGVGGAGRWFRYRWW